MLAACDEARHVHRAEHLRTGEGHRLGAEDVVLRGLRASAPPRGRGPEPLVPRALPGPERVWVRESLRLWAAEPGRAFPSSGPPARGLRPVRGGRRCGRCGFRASRPASAGEPERVREPVSRPPELSGRSSAFAAGAAGWGAGFTGLGLGCGLGLGSRSRLGLGREVDLAEELRLLNLVLDADDVAFDDNLLLFLALLLPGFFEGYGRLLQGDAFADRITCAGGGCGSPRTPSPERRKSRHRPACWAIRRS